MKIQLKYFASIREQIGLSQEILETNAADLKALRLELISRSPAYAEALAEGKAIKMAINQVVCEGLTPLKENAEIAFFPPVTGG